MPDAQFIPTHLDVSNLRLSSLVKIQFTLSSLLKFASSITLTDSIYFIHLFHHTLVSHCVSHSHQPSIASSLLQQHNNPLHHFIFTTSPPTQCHPFPSHPSLPPTSPPSPCPATTSLPTPPPAPPATSTPRWPRPSAIARPSRSRSCSWLR